MEESRQEPPSARKGLFVEEPGTGDVEAIVERYRIPGLTYHIWEEGARGRPKAPKGKLEPARPVSARARVQDGIYVASAIDSPSRSELPSGQRKPSGTSRLGRRLATGQELFGGGLKGNRAGETTGAAMGAANRKAATVPWDEPEDLRSGPLPILAGMPLREGLVEGLTRRNTKSIEAVEPVRSSQWWERLAPLSELEEAPVESSVAGPTADSGNGEQPTRVHSVTVKSSEIDEGYDGMDPVYPPLNRTPPRQGSRASLAPDDPVARVFRSASRGSRPLSVNRAGSSSAGQPRGEGAARESLRSFFGKGMQDE